MTAAGMDVGKASLGLAVDGHAGVVRFTKRTGIAKRIKWARALASESWARSAVSHLP